MYTMKRTIKKIVIFTLVLAIAFLHTGCFFLAFFDLLSTEPPVSTKEPSKVEIVFLDGNFSKTNERIVRSCLLLVDEGELNAEDYSISWTANNQKVNGAGAYYSFMPSTTAQVINVGATLKYTNVDGEVKELSATNKFLYCNEIQNVEVEEYCDNDSVSYSVKDVDDNLNVIQWFVDGKEVSNSADFEFAPTLGGVYGIELKVNGKEIALTNATVTIEGNSEINDLYIDYDTHYPLVEVGWNESKYDGEYKIVVEKSYGEQEYFTSENSVTFTQEQFPLNLCDVTVRVQAMGNEYITASPLQSKTAKKLNALEISYLQTNYGIANVYVMSSEEFYVQFDFMMLSRPQPTQGEETRLSRDFYMAYDYGDFDKLCSYAFDKSAYAGNYRLGCDTLGKIGTVDLYFKTVNEPTNTEYAVIPSAYNSNLNGYEPYQQEVVNALQSLPIDAKQPVEVTTTDMLYRVAEMGYKPVPQEGSRAQEYYAYARELLQNIMDANATEYEIALTLYDWLIYKNNYDNSVVSLDIERAVQSPAFYIEGVLNPNYGFGVCDGMAKTYSLLCNMMGVECMRVTGVAGEGENKGGHAWNKVKIEGKWYVVDPTWGDMAVSLQYRESVLPTLIKRTFEIGSHAYFLITDLQISKTHVEDDYGYPQSHYAPYPHFEQKETNDYDWYLNESGIDLEDAMVEIVVKISHSLNVINSFVAYDANVSSNFFLYEIGYNKGNKEEVFDYFSSRSILAREIKGKGYYYEMFEINSTIMIIISKRCRLQDVSL